MDLKNNPAPNKELFKKKLHFDIWCIVGGVLLSLAMLALIYFGVPQLEPARRLTIFILILGTAFSIVVSFTTAALIRGYKGQKDLYEIQQKKLKEEKPS